LVDSFLCILIDLIVLSLVSCSSFLVVTFRMTVCLVVILFIAHVISNPCTCFITILLIFLVPIRFETPLSLDAVLVSFPTLLLHFKLLEVLPSIHSSHFPTSRWSCFSPLKSFSDSHFKSSFSIPICGASEALSLKIFPQYSCYCSTSLLFFLIFRN
jgi:hypothetical protein